MAFTTATLTHAFINGDGTPASGQVTFQLTGRMTNGGQTILPTEVIAALNASGQLSQAVTANLDAGTTPSDVMWQVSVRILGATAETFNIQVPAGGGSVDLGTLLPGNQQVD